MRNPFTALFERRNIATSYDLLQTLRRGFSTVAGADVTETTAMNVAAVYTGVSIRAELFATLPVDVIEKTAGQRGSKQLPDDPIARVLLKPNSFQTGCELLSMLETHRLLRGSGRAWINWVKDGKDMVPAELIPLHPDQMTVEAPKTLGAPTIYKLSTVDGKTIEIPAAEIFDVKNFSTNGRTGRSFLYDMREVIGGALATQEHANSLWSRDATPTVALEHPNELGADAKKNLEDSWEAVYGQGKDKRRVAVLEEGMKIKQLSLSPNDGQFLETTQDLTGKIAAALRVPPFLMGLAEKSTSWGTGIEQQQIGLAIYALRPSCVTYEQRMHRDLLRTHPRKRVKFNVWAMLRGDVRSQFDAFWRGIQMGVYSPNDVRDLLDLNPIPNGDTYLQPVNMGPLGLDPFAASKGNAE